MFDIYFKDNKFNKRIIVQDKSFYSIHQDLLKDIILKSQKEFKNLRLFQATNGLFYTKRGTPVKIGTVGMPDLFGFIGDKSIFVEVKSGKTGIVKNSPQDKFKKMCLNFGVIHIEATSATQMINELKRILNV